MPLDDVMNALGGAGQILVAAIAAVIFLIVVLWILIPFTVLGLRGRVREIRDDQRRVLAALTGQQRTLNEMLGRLVAEQQVANDILARLTDAGDVEPVSRRPPAAQAAPPPAPSPDTPPARDEPASLDGRGPTRGPRPPRPLVANR